MKALLVGIGSFGLGWYRTLKARSPHLQLVVVDRDPALAANRTAPCEPFYTDLQQAFDREQPDFVVNLTPPAVHTSINHQAFDRRLPVLCEKPIAEDYSQAAEIVARSVREGLLFMIAENYRRWPVMRLARRLIAQDEIGAVTGVSVGFYKERFYAKEYLLNMPDPLLQDVTVHHFDLMRYLAGADGRRILAHSYNPPGSHYPGNAALSLILELETGVTITYTGTLAGKDSETGWGGDWRIEGERGVLLIAAHDDNPALRLISGGKMREIADFTSVEAPGCLDDFLTALATGREPETSGSDYLQTQALVHHAQQSARMGGWVEISKERR
jgi:predicted dehydrogenase